MTQRITIAAFLAAAVIAIPACSPKGGANGRASSSDSATTGSYGGTQNPADRNSRAGVSGATDTSVNRTGARSDSMSQSGTPQPNMTSTRPDTMPKHGRTRRSRNGMIKSDTSSSRIKADTASAPRDPSAQSSVRAPSADSTGNSTGSYGATVPSPSASSGKIPTPAAAYGAIAPSTGTSSSSTVDTSSPPTTATSAGTAAGGTEMNPGSALSDPCSQIDVASGTMRSTQGATVPRPTDTSVATSSTAGLRDTTGYGNNPNKSRDTLQGNQPVTPPARTPSPSGAAGLSAADRQFVETAGNGGLAEVVLGCLAKQRATNPQVKEFAQRMIDDHSKANQQLMQLSVQKGVTLALQLQGDPKAAMDKLSGLTGAAFDKAYMNDMVSDHQQDVAAFEHESTGGQDADTKALATQTLPTLRQHLELAQQVNAAVK